MNNRKPFSRKTIALFAIINIVGWLAAIYVNEHRELHTVYSQPCSADKPVIWQKRWQRSVLWDWLIVKDEN